jgi:hypothetical protein
MSVTQAASDHDLIGGPFTVVESDPGNWTRTGDDNQPELLSLTILRNLDVFTSIIRGLGVEGLEVEEVYSIEPWATDHLRFDDDFILDRINFAHKALDLTRKGLSFVSPTKRITTHKLISVIPPLKASGSQTSLVTMLAPHMLFSILFSMSKRYSLGILYNHLGTKHLNLTVL